MLDFEKRCLMRGDVVGMGSCLRLFSLSTSTWLSPCVDAVLMDVAYLTMEDTEKQLYCLLERVSTADSALLPFYVNLFLANIDTLSLLSGEHVSSGLVHESMGAASST